MFVLEEPSMKYMLEGLLPRMNLKFEPVFRVCEGKQDLKLRLYSLLKANPDPGVFFIVMRDKDQDDCIAVKNDLCGIAQETGRNFRVRIVCRELESWYLAQLDAVKKIHSWKPPKSNNGKKYKNPENSGADELKKYTKGQYMKTSSSRSLGRLLDPDSTNSKSFQVFIQTLRDLDEGKISS